MSPFGEGGQGGRRRPPRRARDKRWGTGVRRGAPGVWLPPAKFRNGIWGVRHRHRPTTPRGGTRDGTPGRRALRGWLRRAAAIALGQRRTAERLRQRGWNRSRGHPKRGQQRRTIPQSALRLTAPFAQGSLWGRGMRIAASAPTESPINHPSQPARSEASEPAAARDGRESAQGPSQKGTAPRLPRQRLAKRKARKEQLVKFDFCPTTSEFSTAYEVRKPQQGSARAHVGAALIEQDSLGPHPVVQEDAERPGCTTRTRFFF